jgi:hypothetical protein
MISVMAPSKALADHRCAHHCMEIAANCKAGTSGFSPDVPAMAALRLRRSQRMLRAAELV